MRTSLVAHLKATLSVLCQDCLIKSLLNVKSKATRVVLRLELLFSVYIIPLELR